MCDGAILPLEHGVAGLFPRVIRGLFQRESADVVLECRRCGQSVSGDGEGCPHCGPEAPLVEYVID
jgi:rubrerythrin